MLSGEVGPFTQQLALGQGEDTGRLPDQHRVVEAAVTRSRGDQVTTLNTDRGRRMWFLRTSSSRLQRGGA